MDCNALAQDNPPQIFWPMVESHLSVCETVPLSTCNYYLLSKSVLRSISQIPIIMSALLEAIEVGGFFWYQGFRKLRTKHRKEKKQWWWCIFYIFIPVERVYRSEFSSSMQPLNQSKILVPQAKESPCGNLSVILLTESILPKLTEKVISKVMIEILTTILMILFQANGTVLIGPFRTSSFFLNISFLLISWPFWIITFSYSSIKDSQ